MIDLALLLRAERRTPAFVRAGQGTLAQEGIVVVAAGDGKGGERRPDPAEIEIALGGNRGAGIESRFAPPPAFRERGRVVQRPAAIGMAEAAFAHDVEGDTLSQCREHVVHQAAAAVDVARVLRHDPRHARAFGQRDQGTGKRRFIATGVMTLHLDRNPAAELLAPLMDQAHRLG